MSLRAIFLLAVLLRAAPPLAGLLWAEQRPQIREDDSRQYVELAGSLVTRRTFALAAGPEVARTPGYPLLLAPGAWLDRWAAAGVASTLVDAWALALQVLAGAASVLLVHGLARALFECPAAAKRAAWCMALEPLSVLYCGKLLTETLFVTCFLAGLLAIVRFHAGRSVAWLPAAGLAFAAAMFVRPIGYYWPWVAAAWLAWACMRGQHRPMWATAAGAALAAASLAPAFAWQARNSQAADYAGFAAIVDENLLFWQAAGVLAERQEKSLADVQRELGYSRDAIYVGRHPELTDATRGEIYRAKRREALGILQAAPQMAAWQHVSGILSTLSDPGTNAWLHYFSPPPPERPRIEGEVLAWRVLRALKERPTRTLVHVGLCLALVGYWAAAAAGAVRDKTWRRPASWLLLAAAAYLALLSGGPGGYHRLRLPIVPLMAVWAGRALTRQRPAGVAESATVGVAPDRC